MQTRKAQPIQRTGFTLLEVLLVVAILGVIAAMVVPQLLGRQQESYVNATRVSIKSLEKAVKIYAQSNDGEYPQGNAETVFGMMMNPGQDTNGKAIQPFLEEIPRDAWKQPLNFEWPNSKVTDGRPAATKPAIWSNGPNKQNDNGSGDDINNWDELVSNNG